MSPAHSDAGFSLPEVLIAAALAAVALVSLATLLVTSIESATAARHRTAATLLAQAKVEELLTIASAGGAPPAGGVESISGSGRADAASGEPLYTRRWSVEPLTVNAIGIRVEVVRQGAPASSAVRVATVRRRRP